MRYLSQLAQAPSRLDWRNPQTSLRLAILVAVAAVVVAVVLLHDRLDLAEAGYGAVALTVLVGSGGLIVPVPALAAACTAATFLNPAIIGLIAGTAGAVGELTGYFLGSTGRGVVDGSRLYQKVESGMRHRGWLVLFVMAAIPNPVFDIAGIAAGALRYPLWRFLPVVWLGKITKFLYIGYGCASGAKWLTGAFGL